MHFFIYLYLILQRIRHYMDWSKNTTQFLVLKEIHSTFLDCFLTTAATSTKSEDDGKPQKHKLNVYKVKRITISLIRQA